jgi:hypothetical protein
VDGSPPAGRSSFTARHQNTPNISFVALEQLDLDGIVTRTHPMRLGAQNAPPALRRAISSPLALERGHDRRCIR